MRGEIVPSGVTCPLGPPLRKPLPGPLEGAAAEMTSRRPLLRAATWRSRRKQFLRWTQSVCVLVREEPGRSEGRRRREEEEDDDEEEEVLGTRARRLWRRREEGGAERRRRSPAGAARRSESRVGQCEKQRVGDAAATAARRISGPCVASLPGTAPQVSCGRGVSPWSRAVPGPPSLRGPSALVTHPSSSFRAWDAGIR